MGMMEDMMKRMMAEAAEEEARKPKPLPEAVIMDLKGVAERYANPCPFKVGDLVTARQESDMKGAGDPHVVIDVLEKPQPVFSGQPGTNMFGLSLDMRVLHQWEGKITSHWVESQGFEAWAEVSK